MSWEIRLCNWRRYSNKGGGEIGVGGLQKYHRKGGMEPSPGTTCHICIYSWWNKRIVNIVFHLSPRKTPKIFIAVQTRGGGGGWLAIKKKIFFGDFFIICWKSSDCQLSSRGGGLNGTTIKKRFVLFCFQLPYWQEGCAPPHSSHPTYVYNDLPNNTQTRSAQS